VRVLNYHGVVDQAEAGNHFAALFTDLTSFDEQASLLARRARLVSLSEVEAALTGGHRLPDDAVHVSFDDGYVNNLRAAEVLDRHRIPWSLFVVVDSVLDGYRPWFVRLADAIEATTNVMLPDGSIFEMSDPKRKRDFARRAKVQVMAAPDADQDGAVDSILAWPGMNPGEDTSWPMLDLAGLKELQTAGVEVGNHSARHRNLRRCHDGDLASEVTVSRTRLEQALGRPVRWFAYPDGRHDRRVRRAVGLHHTLGFATWTVRPAEDRFAVRRYEPIGVADLGPILDSPEPWYGARWARWTLPWRAREAGVRVRRRPARRNGG
jgi:peptidoglycan/xylan/chitin deacetylase (PgdA/CDA1 family)